MRNREVKHTVYGRPARNGWGSRPSVDAALSRGLLTWWDVMSDLDPDWMGWTESVAQDEADDQRDIGNRLDGDDTPGRRVA